MFRLHLENTVVGHLWLHFRNAAKASYMIFVYSRVFEITAIGFVLFFFFFFSAQSQIYCQKILYIDKFQSQIT